VTGPLEHVVSHRSVQELPGIRAVEAPHRHGIKKLWIKVSQVHAMACSWFRLQWFPVGDASASGAANCSQGLVALDVLLRVFWVPGDPHCAEFIVGPDSAKASADGAVAACGLLWGGRQLDRDGTAVTGSYKHGNGLAGFLIGAEPRSAIVTPNY
jgi:hypothetical protein